MSHDDFPGWVFRLTITGAGAVTGLSITWAGGDLDPTTGLPPTMPTGRRWRSIPVSELADAARARVESIRELAQEVADRRGIDLARWSSWAAEEFAAQPVAGRRRGRDDREYAVVAARYVQAVAEASPHPVEDVAAALFLSPSQVRNLLYEARRRELLTRAGRGRAGGHLTDKARDLLANTPTEKEH